VKWRKFRGLACSFLREGCWCLVEVHGGIVVDVRGAGGEEYLDR
jgi:hypothetical protein